MPSKMSFFRQTIYLVIMWVRKHRLSRFLTFLAIFSALIAGVATYIFFTNTEFLFSNPRKVILLLNFDLAVLLFLGIIVARQLVKVWVQRRSGQAGAKLHVRLVIIFSTLAAVPAITVALFSAYFFNAGVQSWFNDRVKTALTESSVIAKAYLEEHKKVISANVHAMAVDISQQMASLMTVPEIFNQFLDLQIDIRNLDEALVFNTTSQILARSRFTFVLEFERLSNMDLQNADHTVVIKTNESGDRVRALIKIPHVDAYLLVGRVVDPTVLKRINLVEKAVGEYSVLQNRLSDLELKFTLIFILLALLLLFVAVWLGLLFATRLVKPIRSLITVAEKVRTGDLSARVAEPGGNDEFTLLANEFNRMTDQLQGQQKKLIQANRQLDARRKFIEDVLAGVTAGVLGLSKERVVQITNRSAAELLEVEINEIIGKKIEHILPSLEPLFMQVDEGKQSFLQSQLTVDVKGLVRVLLIRIVVEQDSSGYILTFDDVTELVGAQRKAAWADVARKIAHEIKNPLTPIQLSAERLRQKYANLTSSDDKFDAYISTIIKQVEHIGRMVSEFSDFARMPHPQMRLENVVDLCKQSILLQQAARQDIDFNFIKNHENVMFKCDASQMMQVLTNLLQNSIDSVDGERIRVPDAPSPIISVILEETPNVLHLIVEDNGSGFPHAEQRERLTEPYVTLRTKGTGLGLAIVKKIVEDHKGSISLEDKEGGGARVRLTFTLNRD